ncbi:MAG: mitochondrial fission ELM1 family protein [Robiginitomaculum sp.]|nr:mitochondrial fission ELM1 family protein [Robiginitomaculum sp.]
MSAKTGKFVIWTIGDGRAGIENQVQGLAEAIGDMLPVEIKNITAPKPGLLTLFKAKKPLPEMLEPWPDVVIGCGQGSIPYMIAMRKWSNGKTLTVQLQSPRRKSSLFDLIIAPQHDRLKGDNVLSIVGATNRISEEKLLQAKEKFKDRIAELPGPRLAVIIGGNSKRHKLTKELFKDLLGKLLSLSNQSISLLITTSRRTPGFVKRGLRRKFKKNKNVWLWVDSKNDGDNPYFAFLSVANAVVVTSDSTNMLTDAASAGKPVLMFRLDGNDGKFSDLHEELEKQNYVHPFTGAISTWPVEPLSETKRAAEEVLRRYYSKLKSAQHQGGDTSVSDISD